MINILRESIHHWKSRNAPRMGAALSYYAMLSFIPLLLLLVTFASSVFSKELVQGTLVFELSRVVGTGTANYIGTVLSTSSFRDITLTTAIISALVTLFGAVNVFTELDQDFDTLWDTPKAPKLHATFAASVWGYIQKKLVAFSFVPLLVLILLLIIGITVFFGLLGNIIAIPTSLGFLISAIKIIGPLVLGTALFAVIYRILPDCKLPWKVLFFGALTTTVLFMIGNEIIIEYIKLLVHTDVFGGAASLVGLLVWVYYSAQVFFFGASFTFVYAKRNNLIPSRD